jgi:hypothetical protein
MGAGLPNRRRGLSCWEVQEMNPQETAAMWRLESDTDQARLQKLSVRPDAKRAIDDDKGFFLDHPERRFRVRPPMLGDVPGGVINPKSKLFVRVIIRDEENGFGLKIPFLPLPGDQLHTEAGCALIWERLAAAMTPVERNIIAEIEARALAACPKGSREQK